MKHTRRSEIILALVLAISIRSTGQTEQQQFKDKASPVDSTGHSSHALPPSVQPNRTLIGAVVESVTLLAGQRYKINLELRTAIPADGLESLAEPGQRIIALPSYQLTKKKAIDNKDARTRRLIEARRLKAGDFLFGKITFREDGNWYLLDTKLE